jgi:hypothetical protein
MPQRSTGELVSLTLYQIAFVDNKAHFLISSYHYYTRPSIPFLINTNYSMEGQKMKIQTQFQHAIQTLLRLQNNAPKSVFHENQCKMKATW